MRNLQKKERESVIMEFSFEGGLNKEMISGGEVRGYIREKDGDVLP